jgi:hypothetical protein
MLKLMEQKFDDLMTPGVGAAGRRVTLSDEVVTFIESGLSIVVGVVGPGGRALTGRALAARVMPDATIRLIYVAEGNATITDTVQSGGPIAVTFTAPLSHRTVQIKGFSTKPEEVEPEDEASAWRQTDALVAVLGAMGHSTALVQAFSDYRSSAPLVLSFPVQDAFEQTPGPGAGRSL